MTSKKSVTKSSARRTLQPSAVGGGFIALDIVQSQWTPGERLYAGGSTGNVMTILSFMGWKSQPIARLGDDAAAEVLTRDMERFGVDTSLVSYSPNVATPIVLERIRSATDGSRRHSFNWRCPDCAAWYPRYRPVPAKLVAEAAATLSAHTVVYFDRVNAGTVKLAEQCKAEGALVVFEPSNASDKAFAKAASIADVLKYSHERLGRHGDLLADLDVMLQIETMGSEGLRYQLNGQPWSTLAAVPAIELKDAAGAGDWCTAGFLYRLVGGRATAPALTNSAVKRALRFGQALAALTCSYEGARGSMYEMNWAQHEQLAERLLKGVVSAAHGDADASDRSEPTTVCRSCRDDRRLAKPL